MMLLTKKNRADLPALYSQEETVPEEQIAVVKFFTPDAQWTWYATEFDSETGMFFGLVDGLEKELGYFSLAELQSARGPLGLPIERDMYWTPVKLSEVM